MIDRRLVAILFAAIFWAAPAPATEEARLGAIIIDYAPPTDPSLKPYHDLARAGRMLEHVRAVFAPLRLPRPLTVRTASCDGEADAWYENDVVQICYEYLRYVDGLARRRGRPAGLSEKDAFLGPVIEVFLHEAAHAIFDLLRIPILGKEEDAADHLAALGLLSFGPERSKGLIAGLAHMHLNDAGFRSPRQLNRRHLGLTDPRAMADEHSTALQRLYTVLCLAVGSGDEGFAAAVGDLLPADRTGSCPGEYAQVVHAYRTLVLPHVDPASDATGHPFGWVSPSP